MARGRLNSSTDLGYISSPTTCPSCYPKVIGLLDTYRDTTDSECCKKELSIMECECKDNWRSTLETSKSRGLPEQVARAYEEIGRAILGEDWWSKHGANVLMDVSS